jgi:hypothetical protein
VLLIGTNLVGKRTLYLMCYDRAREYRSADDKCRLWYWIVADVIYSKSMRTDDPSQRLWEAINQLKNVLDRDILRDEGPGKQWS